MNTPNACPRLGPGIHSNIPMVDYLSDPCPTPSLSSSIAIVIDTDTPRHAWAQHPRLGCADPDFSNKADLGTAMHEALFGDPDTIVFVDAADWRTKFAQSERDNARAAGKVALLAEQRGAVRDMLAAAREFCAEAGILHIIEKGVAEETLIWSEGGEGERVTGAMMDQYACAPAFFRIRPDLMSYDANTGRSVMLHYKTTGETANPERFIRGVMRSKNYAFTLRFYARGAEALAHAGHPELQGCEQLILVQEQFAPYACSLIALDPAMTAIADARVDRSVATWKRCMAQNRWPAYGSQVHYAEPTTWEMAAAEVANMAGDKGGAE